MTYLTPPRPIRAARQAGFEHFLTTSARIFPSTNGGSRRKGTVEEGLGLIGDTFDEHGREISIGMYECASISFTYYHSSVRLSVSDLHLTLPLDVEPLR